MLNEDELIKSICDEFEGVDVSNLDTIDEVVAVARKYQDIVESHGLVTTHHINEAIDEPDDDGIVSVVTSLDDEDGNDTGFGFVIHYSLSEGVYTIFADVDYIENIEEELEVPDEEEYEE